MSSSAPSIDPRAKGVVVTEDELTVVLADGRTISAPLAWFPRLLHASPAARQKFRVIGNGIGINWPELDEDLSIEGLLRGSRAPGA